MYKTTLSLRPHTASSSTPASEPGLFDEVVLGLNEMGKPWSPVDPPLADVSELPATQQEATTEVFELESAESRLQEFEATSESDDDRCDDDTVILEDEELLRSSVTSTVGEAVIESASLLEIAATVPEAPEPVTFIEEPEVEEAMTVPDTIPIVEAPAIESTIVETPIIEPPAPVKPAVAPEPLPPVTATTGDRITSPRPTAVPRRIGSGRLVPARLTWKPRDPFACPSKPKKQRFRWEVMLTSACITAVCGLGCVWILRTLLA